MIRGLRRAVDFAPHDTIAEILCDEYEVAGDCAGGPLRFVIDTRRWRRRMARMKERPGIDEARSVVEWLDEALICRGSEFAVEVAAENCADGPRCWGERACRVF